MSVTEHDHLARDPRVDPRAGDVLWKGKVVREVSAVTLNEVKSYTARGLGIWSLSVWRKWAKCAEVIRAAE